MFSTSIAVKYPIRTVLGCSSLVSPSFWQYESFFCFKLQFDAKLGSTVRFGRVRASDGAPISGFFLFPFVY